VVETGAEVDLAPRRVVDQLDGDVAGRPCRTGPIAIGAFGRLPLEE
jgi:hypothetical protein